MYVLGIETSCDETSVSVVSRDKKIHSLVTLTQLEEHKPYGGVVPEIAARSHIAHIDTLAKEALSRAEMDISNIDAFAATGGPGLIGGVLVGVMFAKSLASVCRKPFIAVNHLEGHALTARLTDEVEFPYLLLLVSGGHCQLLEVLGVGEYVRMGGTCDDAVGEAFDKVAKMLGLGYPGGPNVEKMAKLGDPYSYDFPKPMVNSGNLNFSFSGLKTAVRNCINKSSGIDVENICASFQRVVADVLSHKVGNAIEAFKNKHQGSKQLVIAGGVASNLYIRGRLEDIANEYGFSMHIPPINLCTDNAAMIAWAGIERLNLGLVSSLDFEPKSRWPLEEL